MEFAPKYIIKTDLLKGFSVDDLIERTNDTQYCLPEALPGDRAISKSVIENNKEWFYPIHKHTDLCKQMIEDWDAGMSVWSIEMGGLGPGYEQAIQVLMIETLRELLDEEPVFDSEKDSQTVKSARDRAINRLDQDWGYSGAQVGVAANLAFHFWTRGPKECLKDEEVQDRKIQVSNSLTIKKP